MISAVDINNGHQWAIIDSNGQQSAVLHASVMPFFCDNPILKRPFNVNYMLPKALQNIHTNPPFINSIKTDIMEEECVPQNIICQGFLSIGCQFF